MHGSWLQSRHATGRCTRRRRPRPHHPRLRRLHSDPDSSRAWCSCRDRGGSQNQGGEEVSRSIIVLVGGMLLGSGTFSQDKAGPPAPRTLSPKEFSEVVFSPDDRLLAGAEGETIRVWDTAKKEDGLEIRPTKVLRGHVGPVTCLAFSVDGKTLVSASADQTICFWDMPGGKKRQRK